jgi:hypothetical protein
MGSPLLGLESKGSGKQSRSKAVWSVHLAEDAGPQVQLRFPSRKHITMSWAYKDLKQIQLL